MGTQVLNFKTTSIQVVKPNSLRKSGMIVNAATNRVWLSGDPNVAVNNGVPLAQFQGYAFNVVNDGEEYVTGSFFAIIETASGNGWFEESERP